MASFLSPLLKADAAQHELVNARTSHVIATNPVAAVDSQARRIGLLKYEQMPDGLALIIAPCNAVHTFGMRFAIDLLFVARDGTVLKTRHAVTRRRIAMAWGAFATIELAAGVLDSATHIGDQIVLRAK